IGKYVIDEFERPTGSLERHDGIFERWRRGIVRDRIDFLQIVGHRGGESRLKVFRLDAIECRITERQSAWLEQWIRFGRSTVVHPAEQAKDEKQAEADIQTDRADRETDGARVRMHRLETTGFGVGSATRCRL